MDCSPPSPSVHGISQAKILKWVVISFSRGSSWPRDQTHVFCIGFIIAKLLGKPPTAMTLKSFRMREGLGLKNTTRATRKCLNKWSREMRTCWMTRWRKEEHKIFKRPETDYNIIISLHIDNLLQDIFSVTLQFFLPLFFIGWFFTICK